MGDMFILIIVTINNNDHIKTIHDFTDSAFMNSGSAGLHLPRNMSTSTNDTLNQLNQGDYYVDNTSSD
jgi:hypothetical protein